MKLKCSLGIGSCTELRRFRVCILSGVGFPGSSLAVREVAGCVFYSVCGCFGVFLSLAFSV